MESISQALNPYKDLVGTVASYVTIAQFFSGAFICKDIYKKGHTRGTTAIPFIGGVVMGTLMLKYALILSDSAMLTVNVAAIILNSIYTVFYYQYSASKWDEILKPMSVGAALVAIFLGYAEWEDKSNIEYRYGLIVTVLMLMLLGAPLMDLKTIVDKKDASSIPFPITLMGTIVTFLWLLYGIILLNNFMIIQNGIGFALCFVQLVLIFLYPAQNGNQNSNQTPQGSKKKKARKAD